jgi:hypothetical protein
MVPLLVSVAAGGLVVGLFVGAIGLLIVRSTTPSPAEHLPVRPRIRSVEEPEPLGDRRDRRSVA